MIAVVRRSNPRSAQRRSAVFAALVAVAVPSTAWAAPTNNLVFEPGVLADFTGDGLVDFADHYWPSGAFWIHENTTTSGFAYSNWPTFGQAPNYTTAQNANQYRQYVADFNGDGLADFATLDMYGGALTIHLNQGTTVNANGSTFESQPLACDSNPRMALATNPTWRIAYCDISGDGQTDEVDYDLSTGDIYYYMGLVSDYFNNPAYALLGGPIYLGQLHNQGGNWLTVFTDLDLDGSCDYAQIQPGSNGTLYGYLNNHSLGSNGFDSTPWLTASGLMSTPETEVLFGRADPSASYTSVLLHYPGTSYAGSITPGTFSLYDVDNQGGNIVLVPQGVIGGQSESGRDWELLGNPHRSIEAEFTGSGLKYESYSGGPILGHDTIVVPIFYGNFSTSDEDYLIASNFVDSYSGTAHQRIASTYLTNSGLHVENSYTVFTPPPPMTNIIPFQGYDQQDTITYGTNNRWGYTTPDGQQHVYGGEYEPYDLAPAIIAQYLGSAGSTQTGNMVFAIFISQEITEQTLANANDVGWYHWNYPGMYSANAWTDDTVYAIFPESADTTLRYGTACKSGDPHLPLCWLGYALSDGFMHEFNEAATNPLLTTYASWNESNPPMNTSGGEMGDLCQYKGAPQCPNLTMGKYTYSLEQLWINTSVGGCVCGCSTAGTACGGSGELQCCSGNCVNGTCTSEIAP